MHRIKKILYISLITIGFALCFIFGKNKINILAMGNFNNSIGTIPIQMDIDNYNTENKLFGFNSYNGTYTNTACGVTAQYNPNNNNIVMNGTATCSNVTIYNFGTFYLNNVDAVTLKLFYVSGSIGIPIGSDINAKHVRVLALGNGSFGNAYGVNETDSFLSSKTLATFEYFTLVLMINQGNSAIDTIYDDYTFRLYYDNNYYDNTQLEDLQYSSPFIFGYNASLSYFINTTSSTTVNYYFNDNTYTKTTDIVNSGYLIENYYIPFNIDSKGYISFSNIIFGISSISNSSSNNIYSLYLELTPVFNAYYKGESTKNIYTKLNYMTNDLFFSGITFSGCNGNSCSNTINTGNLSLNNPKTLAVTELNDTGNITSTNISTYYNEDIKNRNYFVYNNYLNVGFRIGDLAMNYNYMNGRNYSFGISSLASRIVDNQTTTTPLPDNELTNDKYNSCSAWYDIPCQLGNAITYVIYEAPIISPIINFFDGFIDLVQSFVTYITWFEGLGLIFGIFIVIFFIRMIILLVKGGNDD